MGSKFEGKQIDCYIVALTYCCTIISLHHYTITPLYHCKTKVKLAPFRQYSYKVNATNK